MNPVIAVLSLNLFLFTALSFIWSKNSYLNFFIKLVLFFTGIANLVQAVMSLDPYPTEDEEKQVAEWDYTDRIGLMNFVQSLWMYVEWGLAHVCHHRKRQDNAHLRNFNRRVEWERVATCSGPCVGSSLDGVDTTFSTWSNHPERFRLTSDSTCGTIHVCA